MNSSSIILCVLLLSLSSAAHADTIWGSCDGIGISFKLFTLFPNPVTVGQIVDGNAVISLQNNVNPGDIKSGTISVEITYNKGYTFRLANIPLCNSTNAIVCNTLSHGDNTISFSYRVPKIPAGTYDIRITAIVNGANIQTSCLTFQLTVVDPTQTGLFHSFIEAHLIGQAQFENPNYLARGLGDIVQVGPVGPVPSVYSNLFEWGTFMSVTGSQDVVSPYFSPANFVWGLNGTMVTMRYLNSSRQQTYRGDFTIGYVSDTSKRTMDLELIDGTFNLTWSYTVDPSGKVSSTLSGTLIFSDVATLPSGWSYPITLGRFAELYASTSELGILVVTASTDYCQDPSACPVPSAIAVNPTTTNKNKNSSTPLSARNLGLIIGLGVGGFLILILIIAIIIWRRYHQRNSEEDGIFSAARKPEYGNALVVDDIIQETRERPGDNTLIPRLAKRQDDSQSEESESDEEPRRGGRGRERSPSPDSRSASLDSEDDEPSRPPPRYRSRSRGGDDDGSDYSRSDAGSSASRSDDEDER